MSFAALAPELQLSIISDLSHADKHCLCLASRALNHLVSIDLDFPLEQLGVACEKKTILVVDEAKEGALGFEPFIISKFDKIPSDGPSPHILIDIYYPLFMQNTNKPDAKFDENEWQIHIHMKTLSLDTDNMHMLPLKPPRVVESVDYESFRGKLVLATPGLLRARFTCPECKSSRSVCPGCRGFSERRVCG